MFYAEREKPYWRRLEVLNDLLAVRACDEVHVSEAALAGDAVAHTQIFWTRPDIRLHSTHKHRRALSAYCTGKQNKYEVEKHSESADLRQGS